MEAEGSDVTPAGAPSPMTLLRAARTRAPLLSATLAAPAGGRAAAPPPGAGQSHHPPPPPDRHDTKHTDKHIALVPRQTGDRGRRQVRRDGR